MLNGLDLFSGIGGITYALREWVRTIAYCEIDPYCQGVLLSRMAKHDIQQAPIWDDIRTFPTSELMGHVDIVFGGFPCQDISIAGAKKGLDGERSCLIFDMFRVVSELKPTFLFIENVPQVIKLGGVEIIKEINEMGMDCRWSCFSATSCGAPHKRDRWFLLAYNHSIPSWKANKETELDKDFRSAWLRYTRRCWKKSTTSYWKENQHPLLGMDYGLQNELDRARSLGNAVVSQQAKEAFKLLIGMKNQKKENLDE